MVAHAVAYIRTSQTPRWWGSMGQAGPKAYSTKTCC